MMNFSLSHSLDYFTYFQTMGTARLLGLGDTFDPPNANSEASSILLRRINAWFVDNCFYLPIWTPVYL